MHNGFVSRGGLWVIGQSLLMLGVVTLGVLFAGQWHQAVCVLTGAVLFVAGAALGVAGVRALGPARTPYPRPKEPGMLVVHGVYARVRHPLYGSVILASLGWGMIWQSGPALVLAVLLGFFLNAKAAVEERFLRQHYPQYAAYARRVWRLLPWIY